MIVGFGSCAGAYLISAVALAGDESPLVGRIGPVPDVSCRVAAVIEHYGPDRPLSVKTQYHPGAGRNPIDDSPRPACRDSLVKKRDNRPVPLP